MYFLLLISCLLSSIVAQSSDPQDATAFALLYGYPLLAWQRFYAPTIQNIGANTWHHDRKLKTPEDRTVVKPNVDTVYSTFTYDLSQSDVEITIPEVPADTFKLFSFYDPFGDNFVNLGTGGFFESGTYLIRPYDRPGGSQDVGLQLSNDNGSYAGSVTSPTMYGLVLVRWGFDSTIADDVHQWQDECESRVLAPSKNLTNAAAPPQLKSLVSVYDDESSPAENVLNLLAKFAPSNAPSQLETAGISNREYTPVSSVDLKQANETAVTEATEAASDPENLVPLNNGWSVLSPDLIGTYDDNYALRSLIATAGYLALKNPYAVYPNYANASAANANAPLSLASDEAILVTFSGKPPLQEAGFWSLTAYASDYFLIPNQAQVYALGDRSDLTYPSGDAVYSNNEEVEDGMFQILIQPANVSPPSNWTNNWLPAPACGGEVIAQLRFFAGEDALSDGQYRYPVLEKIAAVRAANETSGSSCSASSAVSGSPTSTSGSGSSSESGSSSGSDSGPVPGYTGGSGALNHIFSASVAAVICLAVSTALFL